MDIHIVSVIGVDEPDLGEALLRHVEDPPLLVLRVRGVRQIVHSPQVVRQLFHHHRVLDGSSQRRGGRPPLSETEYL